MDVISEQYPRIVIEERSRPFYEEATMAESSKDPQKPKTEAEKKQPETVLLTPEELRAVAGGQTVPPVPPPKQGH